MDRQDIIKMDRKIDALVEELDEMGFGGAEIIAGIIAKAVFHTMNNMSPENAKLFIEHVSTEAFLVYGVGSMFKRKSDKPNEKTQS